MRSDPPRRKAPASACVRTVALAPLMAIALLTLMAPSAGAAVSVSGGDDYSETFESQCGSSGMVEVWHSGGYDSGEGSVTVTGTFPNVHGSMTFTALSSGSGCAQAEFRYFTVRATSRASPQRSSPVNAHYCRNPGIPADRCPDSSIFGVKLDNPDPAETSSGEEKVIGYYLSNDDGSTVSENNAGGVRATEIIEDSDGNARLGDSACLGTIVHTTGQGLSWNRDSQGRFTVAVASSLSGTSGCLDEQDTAAYIAYHQQRETDFAASWPQLYVASAWSYSTG